MRIKSPTISCRLKGQKRVSGLEQDDLRPGDQRGSCGRSDAGRPAADNRNPRIGMEVAELLERVDQRQRPDLLGIEGDASVETADDKQVRPVAHSGTIDNVLGQQRISQ